MEELTPEMDFFIYLLENYAARCNESAGEVLKHWDELQISDCIYQMYERYHSEAMENAFEDIDRMTVEVESSPATFRFAQLRRGEFAERIQK